MTGIVCMIIDPRNLRLIVFLSKQMVGTPSYYCWCFVFSLVSQTLSVPQHRSLSDTKSDRCCGTERVWLARLLCFMSYRRSGFFNRRQMLPAQSWRHVSHYPFSLQLERERVVVHYSLLTNEWSWFALNSRLHWQLTVSNLHLSRLFKFLDTN